MTSGEFIDRRGQLTQLLQRELDFSPDPTGEWLISDELGGFGSYDTQEAFSGRLRVSIDGATIETATRVEDLKGLLELHKLGDRQRVKSIDWMTSFWPEESSVKAYEDDGWIYVSMGLSGDKPDNFERDMYVLRRAQALTIQSALQGMDYERATDDDWFKNSVKTVEAAGDASSTPRLVLFPRDGGAGDEVQPDDEYEYQEELDDEEEIIETTSLAEYPIETYERSLDYAKSSLRVGGDTRRSDDTFLRAHNGAETVAIDAFVRNDDGARETYKVTLNIPEGVTVDTVADCIQLNRATIEIKDSDNQVTTGDYAVNVVVDDDSLLVNSTDGAMEFQLVKPMCEECGIPNWQFPWPDDEKPDKSVATANMSGSFYNINTSLGIFRCLVDTPGTREEHTYCFSCAEDIVEQYVDEFPLADPDNAIAETRRKLDELGYSDVEIMEDHVLRGGSNDWRIYTCLEYERNDRTITRYTGYLQLTDQGDFFVDMQPREYVDFRYASPE